MAKGKSIGTVFVELDLDASRYLKNQKQLYKDATTTSLSIEKNFQNLGIKTDAVFNLMRAKIENSYNAIRNDAQATAQDIIRAEEAKNRKLRELDVQQFGSQTTFLSKMKTNWLAVTAVITGAVMALRKAWDLAEKAAQFDEMRTGLNALSSQYNMTADSAIRMAQAAVGGQLSMQRSGELAAKAFTLGLNPEQVKTFLIQAERLTDVVGGDIPAAFEAMEQAAATGRSRGLVQYGIIVDLNRVLKEYADKHGIAKDSIGETTAMQIRANAIMEAAKGKIDQMGPALDSYADKMNRVRATMKDVQLKVGQVIPRIAAAIIGSWYEIGAATSWAVGKMMEGLSKWVTALDKITLGKVGFLKDARTWLNEYALEYSLTAGKFQAKANENFAAMVASTNELARAQNTGKPAMTGYTKSLKELQETAQAAAFKKELFADIDAVRKGNEEKARLSEQMLDKFFKDEEKLKEKRIKEAEETRVELQRIADNMLQDNQYHLDQKKKQYEDSWAQIIGMANSVGGDTGASLGKMMSGMKGMTDIQSGNDPYTAEIEAANAHYMEMLSLYQGMKDNETLIAQAQAEKEMAIRNAVRNRTLSLYSSQLGAMSGLMMTFYNLTGKQNDTMFKAAKGFAIAEAIINTLVGATKALSQGGFFGILMAAAVIATGMAQVNAIRSQQPEGAGTAPSMNAGGGGYTYTNPTEPIWEKEETKKETGKAPSRTMNVYIMGDVVTHDQLARDIIPSLEKAWGDRVGEQ